MQITRHKLMCVEIKLLCQFLVLPLFASGKPRNKSSIVHVINTTIRSLKKRPNKLTTSSNDYCYVLFVPRIKNHLSSFELGFLNIFSRQNLLRSLYCLCYSATNIERYCLTKISIRAKRSISRVFSLFIVPSPFFCTLPVQRPY